MRKKLLTIVAGAVIGVVYLLYINYSEFGGTPNAIAYALASLIGIANAWVLGRENKWLNKIVGWQAREVSRLTLGVVVNFFASFIITNTLVFTIIFFTHPSLFGELASSLVDIEIKFGVILLMGLIIYNVIYFAQYAYNQYAVARILSLKQQRDQLKLQFEVLRSQLSPHYLFNSLNTISSLVFKDANLAENFIRRLAQTYDYILSTNNARYVSLKDEVEFVRSYNYLLQVRFENNIKLDIDLPKELMDSKIPPLTLQMLVENAVKHNEISDEKPMRIDVRSTQNGCLEVANNKSHISQPAKSFEIGLSNIQKRYSLLCKEKIKVDDGERFKVILPIINSLNLKIA